MGLETLLAPHGLKHGDYTLTAMRHAVSSPPRNPAERTLTRLIKLHEEVRHELQAVGARVVQPLVRAIAACVAVLAAALRAAHVVEDGEEHFVKDAQPERLAE